MHTSPLKCGTRQVKCGKDKIEVDAATPASVVVSGMDLAASVTGIAVLRRMKVTMIGQVTMIIIIIITILTIIANSNNDNIKKKTVSTTLCRRRPW